jgi:hypothetical protein
MTYPQISFKDFAALANKRGHTAESLADIFRGKIEEPREFFERVMTCKWKHEDRSGCVIPYRSAIEFYLKETQYLKDRKEEQERLALKRKRGPVDEQQRQVLIERLEQARIAKSVMAEKQGV